MKTKNTNHYDDLQDEIRPYIKTGGIIKIVCMVAMFSSVPISIWIDFSLAFKILLTSFVCTVVTNSLVNWMILQIRSTYAISHYSSNHKRKH